ncbi:MAG: diguanylate cyclase response regulator [Betaproteobacteria bacterium]|nr:diguanylate cyclase response regulator [Betaproteobacteria bacterium]
MKILIAEADEQTRLRLFALLSQRGYEVMIATNGAEACRLLQHDDAPSLALIGRHMPGLDGLELCRTVRQWSNERYIYMVMLTVQKDTPDIVAGMRAGADDYISKNCAFDELHARLRAGERILKLQEQLRIEATHDVLTGTLNRRAILSLLERQAAQATRHPSQVGILLLDLDHFKKVNDSHGHTTGDDVLTETAKRLAAPLRRYDALGRYGGEEFLIVLPRCDLERTAEVAERVRLSVSKTPIDTSAGKIAITASIGAAAMDQGPVSAHDLIQRADQALYDAKALGRNRVATRVRTLEHAC